MRRNSDLECHSHSDWVTLHRSHCDRRPGIQVPVQVCYQPTRTGHARLPGARPLGPGQLRLPAWMVSFTMAAGGSAGPSGLASGWEPESRPGPIQFPSAASEAAKNRPPAAPGRARQRDARTRTSRKPETQAVSCWQYHDPCRVTDSEARLRTRLSIQGIRVGRTAWGSGGWPSRTWQGTAGAPQRPLEVVRVPGHSQPEAKGSHCHSTSCLDQRQHMIS